MINDYGEDRQKIWDDYIKAGGMQHRIVRHMFVDYSRYHEAKCIIAWFVQNKIPLKDLSILDYGCGAGDYGMLFLREGAKQVVFYDYPRATEFVSYRLKREKLNNGVALSADEVQLVDYPYDLVVFGEVLEHLDKPYDLLVDINDNDVEYIFTSSYPYRSDDPDDPYWNNADHSQEALKAQPDCRAILENNYSYEKFDGELRIWRKK